MVIITGANGFVGQHLAPTALKYFKSSQILCLVSRMMEEKLLEKTGSEILKKNGLKTLEVDLITGKGLDNLPKSPELVIHLAANTDTSKSDHRSNDIGTKNLITALGSLNSKTHIIYTSTTILHSGRVDCSKPITELTPPTPSNEYGRTKLRAEEFLKERAKKDKFRLTIVRINTIYGDDPREHKLFKILKRHIVSNSPIARLNWPGLTGIIHVDDVASALLLLTKKPPKPGKPQTYLLNGENLSLSEISKLMYERMGLKYGPINLPKYFWRLCSFIRRFLSLFEKLTPTQIYNLAWQASLIVDNVIWCESDKIFKVLTKWKPRKFKDAVSDEV